MLHLDHSQSIFLGFDIDVAFKAQVGPVGQEYDQTKNQAGIHWVYAPVDASTVIFLRIRYIPLLYQMPISFLGDPNIGEPTNEDPYQIDGMKL